MNKKKITVIAVCIVAAILIGVVANYFIIPNIGQGTVPQNMIKGFAEKEDGTIRVMSFNIRCTNVGFRSRNARTPDVVATILKGMPDSLGVQEATPAWMKTLDEELGDTYAYVGEGRNGGNKGEYSAIFYLKDKYNLVDSGTFWLSPTPNEVSKGWDAQFNRICTWAILENKETEDRYIHLNSHFDHKGVVARSESIKIICEKSKEYDDLPAVFTADMNVREGSENYKEIAENSVFKDTKYTAKNTMYYLTFHDRFPAENEDRVIDYCFINNKFRALTYGVVTESPSEYFVSDHFPVYADLKINKSFDFDFNLNIGDFSTSINIGKDDIDINIGNKDK